MDVNSQSEHFSFAHRLLQGVTSEISNVDVCVPHLIANGLEWHMHLKKGCVIAARPFCWPLVGCVPLHVTCGACSPQNEACARASGVTSPLHVASCCRALHHCLASLQRTRVKIVIFASTESMGNGNSRCMDLQQYLPSVGSKYVPMWAIPFSNWKVTAFCMAGE